LVLPVVGLFAVAVYAANVLATPATGQSTTTLAKSQFDAINVKAHSDPASIWRAKLKTKGISDVYVVDNKFDPVNTATKVVAGSGWHSHPGPSLIFVVAGTVTNYSSDDPKCRGQSYSAGQGFIDSGKDVHNLRNEGSVTAETIAVQFLQGGAPIRRVDQPKPLNCPF
jgi:hypothetical protein